MAKKKTAKKPTVEITTRRASEKLLSEYGSDATWAHAIRRGSDGTILARIVVFGSTQLRAVSRAIGAVTASIAH